jgi:hypothetical protein
MNIIGEDGTGNVFTPDHSIGIACIIPEFIATCGMLPEYLNARWKEYFPDEGN